MMVHGAFHLDTLGCTLSGTCTPRTLEGYVSQQSPNIGFCALKILGRPKQIQNNAFSIGSPKFPIIMTLKAV